ncbi:MAG: hypothetical protein WA373_02430 [Burkholderiales bacterium]
MTIHENTRAYVGRGLDVRFEKRMVRNVAGEVVVEVAHARAARKQRLESVPVAVERDVEHGDQVAATGIDSLEEPDIVLGAGHQERIGRLVEAQLLQRAQPVGIAIENVEAAHGS